jgi:hypothetical protein
MSLGSHFNVYNSCLIILCDCGFYIEAQGEIDAELCYPTDSSWIAEKDGFRFIADNPIELLGLVRIYDYVKPKEDLPYWWRIEWKYLWSEIMSEAFDEEIELAKQKCVTTIDISIDTVSRANAALRDILFLFMDMIDTYGGFGHGLDTGLFRPLDFIDSRLIVVDEDNLGVNMRLLRSGSGIAVLCAISDSWDECQSADLRLPILCEAKQALDVGRFRHMYEIEKAVRLGLGSDESAFRNQLSVVYERYVVSYFFKLLKVK